MFYNTLEFLEPRELLSGAALTISEAVTASGSQLQITGSAGADKIVISKMSRGYAISASSGFAATYNGKYSSILISAGGGNDRVAVASTVKIPAVIYGGTGNDTLEGGSGNDS